MIFPFIWHTLENEKTTPNLESLIRLSTLFDISLNELIKGNKEMIKDINKNIKKGEYLKVTMLLIVLLITFIVSILMIVWGLSGLLKQMKD